MIATYLKQINHNHLFTTYTKPTVLFLSLLENNYFQKKLWVCFIKPSYTAEDDQSILIETSSCNLQFFSELITTQLRDFHMVSPQVAFPYLSTSPCKATSFTFIIRLVFSRKKPMKLTWCKHDDSIKTYNIRTIIQVCSETSIPRSN